MVHNPVYTHVSNERSIVVLFYNVLSEEPWNQHLFMIVLHTVQDSLKGSLQVLHFELFLGLCQQVDNVWVSRLDLQELLKLSLGQ